MGLEVPGVIRCQPLASAVSGPMSGGVLERSFGKLILNHPIVAVTGTVALLFFGFESIATALEPEAETLLVLYSPPGDTSLRLG